MSPILVSIISSFVSGLVGVLIGTITTMNKVNIRLSLMEAEFKQVVEGRGGILDRMENVEQAVNARRVVTVPISQVEAKH